MPNTKVLTYTIETIVRQLSRKSEMALFTANRALFAGAAALICELRDRLSTADRDRASMAAYLKQVGHCACCNHFDGEYEKEPCKACVLDDNLPAWEWKGA